MDPQQIFGLQVIMSTLLYVLIARWYVGPRLAALPLDVALQPLLLLHASRYVGMVFLVPDVVGSDLPRQFAVPAAYGDLLAAVLAILTLLAWRRRWRVALALTWIFNVVGLLDLLYAVSTGVRLGVQLGGASFIPTLVVPALVVSHVMMFMLLVTRPAPRLAAGTSAASVAR